MSKQNLCRLIHIVENGKLPYGVIFVLRGYRDEDNLVNLGFYFSKMSAERAIKTYSVVGLYKGMFITRELVWF